MKIHETAHGDGALGVVSLDVVDGALVILDGDADGAALPDGALDAVMKRFGAPLDPHERIAEVARLDLGDGRVLRHVRHLARFDVIARDWLVDEAPGREPRCALATTVTGALLHLARASSGAARAEPSG